MRGQQAGAALAERQGLIAAALHLAHEENPESYQEEEGRPRYQRRQPRALAWLFARDLHVLITEHVDQFRIIHWHDGLEGFAACEMAPDVRFRDRYFLDVIPIDFFEESAKWKDLLSPGRSVLHHLIKQHSRRQNQDPEQNSFCCRIQSNPQPAKIAGASLFDTNSRAPQMPLSSGNVHEERIRGKRETRPPRQLSNLQQ